MSGMSTAFERASKLIPESQRSQFMFLWEKILQLKAVVEVRVRACVCAFASARVWLCMALAV
jgi:hypothetical protein